MITLEGPDGVGKTTLGLSASDGFRFGYYRRRVSHCMRAETVKTFKFCDSMVVDRFFVTDRVYSAVHRRSPGLSRTDLYKAAMLAARHSRVNVFMAPVQENIDSYEGWTNVERSICREYCRVFDRDAALEGASTKPEWYITQGRTLFVEAKPIREVAWSHLQEVYRESDKWISTAEAISKSAWISGNCWMPSSLGPKLIIYGEPAFVSMNNLCMEDIIADLLFAAGLRPDEVSVLATDDKKIVDDFAAIGNNKAAAISRADIPLRDIEHRRDLGGSISVDRLFQRCASQIYSAVYGPGTPIKLLEPGSECR